ncbi:MAG: tRNA (adenosine(37)-N6)-dimethylallyltransferase MiaA [Ruminococcaceae bacterium]|nr:tRNA (adenosine(37)-N6)-dimethylallyltransferase MiaA [Oscillospiraceae bacterium]
MEIKKNTVVVIVGPTGVGKTKTSVNLAKKINAKIVSADSMQIYKKMDIGTAKVTKEEMQNIEHYMIDIVNPYEEYNVADYVADAKIKVDNILNDGFVPLVVGGTGLYVDSLINGIDFSVENNDEEYRNYLKNLADEKGNEFVHKMLEEKDYQSALAIHPNNIKRVIRALEIYHTTGKTKTELDKEARKNGQGYESIKIGLLQPREVLYERIDLRVDKMIKEGLIDEVKGILESEKGFSKTASMAIGYREIIAYLKGETSLDEAIFLLKRNSRRYAKRQFTWFTKDENIKWINTLNLSDDDILNECIKIIEKSK